ncbi:MULTISPECIES: AIPR family protein [unclassified Microcoleus]|uniref:AIPR family protein n=1 Tax=unclassified Microcoleus TaxID=2642155 RepID=UPI002FD3FFB0
MTFSYQTAFDARTDLQKYNENALALFALQLRFQIEDIETVAASSLTGGRGDKKCDLIYVDKEAGYIIVIQAYMAQIPTNKQAAPSNKASDLNTAAAWLFNSPLDNLPEGIRSAAGEVRSSLEANQIRFVQFWYVHNLPESTNVKDELQIVEQTVNNALKTQFPNSEVENLSTLEVGQKTLDEWYRALEAPILVTDKFTIPISGGYTISGSDWEAFVTAIPITWLHEVFQRYSDKLFSANVRGYLGSRKSDNNINNGIKSTAKDEPNHFWVFNNGITGLVSEFQTSEVNPSPETGSANTLEIIGISIVNGAQTTGALGSLDTSPDGTGYVQARFVKCNNINTIRKIIEFNNRQNVVEASDFRSNDSIQRRLREEFSNIPDTTYYGGRRGGSEDVIRRPANLLSSDTVAQALAAFHQDPVIAYNNKSDIWRVDTIYSKYFTEHISAEHIVFVYSLLRSVEAKKLRLVDKSRSGSLPKAEEEQLHFLQRRGAHFLLTSAIANCLETFLDKPVPNAFRVSFCRQVSPEPAEKFWEPIVEVTIPFCKQLLPAVKKSLNSNDDAKEAISNFKAFVESIKENHVARFQSFATLVQIRS